MVEAIITYFILVGAFIITALLIKLVPQKYMQKFWVKLHLDNDEPYRDDSY
jgi:hypothetical protein